MNFSEPEKIGLSDKDYKKIYSVFSKFTEIEKVWLYGSRAKHTHQLYSDIDITLEGNEMNLKKQHQIEIALDELYLPYEFDVSIKTQIDNPELLAHIERIGILIYSKINPK